MHWIDPACLPETAGVVDCFIMNADGETDGFVLTDGTETHVPPHLGDAVRNTLSPGSAVRVRGVRLRHADMVAAISVQSEDAAAIVDNGPPGDKEARKAARKQMAHAARKPSEIKGVVRQLLHGPKGEIRGLLLEDGRSGRFAPHEGTALAPLLQAGAAIVMRGDAVVTQHGTVVAVREIGSSRTDLHRLGHRLGGKADKSKPKKHASHEARGTDIV
jgi:hypothetical protein